MKKNNILTKIANGLKRAIEFVVDVLLFVPRFLINGIKGFFKKEAEAEELVEDFGDEEEAVEENQAEPVKESSETESAVEKSVEEQKETTAEATVETSEQTNPVNVEVKPVEENKSADNKTVVEVKVTAAADQPEPATTIETKTPIEQSSGQQEVQQVEKAEETKSAPVAMVGDVVDTNTGKVINKLPQQQQPEKKEEKANKSMPIFGKTDPKCKDLENKLLKDYSIAYKYCQKNLAADTAKAVKVFAIDLIKLYGLKENYNGFDAPVKDDEALARNIISWMANAEYPMLSQESVRFFTSCLNQELYMGQLQHRLDTCAKYIDYYKKKHYPEQLQMEIQEYMKQQSAKENQQLRDMLLNNNNNPYGGVSFA